MFILIKYILGNGYIEYVSIFAMLSISLLYPKGSFTSNFKTASKKRIFNGVTCNWFLYVTM